MTGFGDEEHAKPLTDRRSPPAKMEASKAKAEDSRRDSFAVLLLLFGSYSPAVKLESCGHSTERKRLSGQLQPRAVQTGMSSIGMFLFGLPFVSVGTWATLAGTKLIPMDESKLHAPHWMLAVFGAVFLLGGVMLWQMGWKQLKAENRRQRVMANRTADPALADYAWDIRGYTPPRWSPAVRAIVMAILFSALLAVFNWHAFFRGGGWLFRIVVMLFDALLAYVIWTAIVTTGRALKFGGARVEFARFPFRRSQPVVLRWRVPSGMTRANAGTFTLRCVKEWHERSSSDQDSSPHLVQEQVWCAVHRIAQPQELMPGKFEEVSFELPADVPATQLSSATPAFWELAVELDLAGLDFKESYLVPVY